MSEINAHITVASVVPRADRFLMVSEYQGNALLLNQPAGHWELGETLVQAAQRETLEETCWHTRVTDFLGFSLYTSPRNNVTYCRADFWRSQKSYSLSLSATAIFPQYIGLAMLRFWRNVINCAARLCCGVWKTIVPACVTRWISFITTCPDCAF